MHGQYEDCKEEEMRAIFQSLIGCVPIWFTDYPGHCGEKTITEEKADIINDLFYNINSGSFEGKCLAPCTIVENTLDHVSTNARPVGEEAVYITLDQNVEISRTTFVIDHFTLHNRLGGTIGICKQALWCILILYGLVKSVRQIFGGLVYPENIA